MPTTTAIHKELKEFKEEHQKAIEELRANYKKLENASNNLRNELEDLKNQVKGHDKTVGDHTDSLKHLEKNSKTWKVKHQMTN